MSIYEYNEEEHMRMEREEHYAKGKADGRAEGRREGLEEGEMRMLVRTICKKLRKGKQAAEIADMLELDVETVQKICDIAAAYAPDYEEEEIICKILRR